MPVYRFIKASSNFFDRAENAFVSAYRKYREKDDFDIFIEYIASPRLDGKTLILVDPMLATGGSMELSYKALLTKGEPAKVHVVSAIASQQAVDYVAKTSLPTRHRYGSGLSTLRSMPIRTSSPDLAMPAIWHMAKRSDAMPGQKPCISAPLR